MKFWIIMLIMLMLFLGSRRGKLQQGPRRLRNPAGGQVRPLQEAAEEATGAPLKN